MVADLEVLPKPFEVANLIERVGHMLGDDGTNRRPDPEQVGCSIA